MLTWPAYKACEPHVVLIGLTMLAGSLLLPDLAGLVAMGRDGMAVLAPTLAIARIAARPREERSKGSSPAGSGRSRTPFPIESPARAGQDAGYPTNDRHPQHPAEIDAMEKRQFGKTDMQVTVLGFGGAEIGFEKATPDAVARLLDDALDAGLNVIDTAECYLQSEELIGQAVSSRRSDFYLFTKCGHPEKPGEGDWRPESLLRSIERSLQRLRTDRVDLVQLHSCSEDELRKGDVIDALLRARDKGYTRYIGYSGDGQAARFAIESGRVRHAPDLGQHRRPGGHRADLAAGPSSGRWA